MYNKQEIKNMYSNGMISKAEKDLFMGMIGMETEGSKRIEKEEVVLKSSSDPELIKKALTDNDSYIEYMNRKQNEEVNLRKEAANTVEEVTKEFESICRRTIRKEHETRAAMEARIWSEHTNLFEKYIAAQREMLM